MRKIFSGQVHFIGCFISLVQILRIKKISAKIVIFFFFLVFNGALVNGQWENISLPNISEASSIIGLEYIDDTLGFISTDDSIGIYRTIDGGLTWSERNDNMLSLQDGATSLTDISFSFTSKVEGFMLIRTDNSMLNLYKTINSGQSWEHVYDFGSKKGIVKFFNSEYGIVSTDNFLHITTDTGNTWRTIKIGTVTTFNSKLSYIHLINDSTLSCYFSRGAYYTNDSAYSFVESADYRFTIGKISFADSIGYAFINANLVKSTDNGLTWNEVNTNSDYYGFKSIFVYSEDTLFAGNNDDIYRSTDGGSIWHKQPSSNISGIGYEFIERGLQTIFAANKVQKLVSTVNYGGCIAPNLEQQGQLFECSGDSIDVINTNDASYNYYWKFNNEVISEEKDLHWRIPIWNNTGYESLTLFGSFSGQCYDSVSQSLYIYAHPTPPEFQAWLEPDMNCENGKFVIGIYPAHLNYSFSVSPENSDERTNLSFVSISSDTAFFETSMDLNLNYTVISSIDNRCGSGELEKPLIINSTPFVFDNTNAVFSKTIYCPYDTIVISLDKSQIGAKYWINGTLPYQQISNPDTVIGVGASIQFRILQSKIDSRNLTLHYISSSGCQSSINLDVYQAEEPNLYFTLETGLYRHLDTLAIDRRLNSFDSICNWNLNSIDHDTAISTILQPQIVLSKPGEYSLNYSLISKNSCRYLSDTLYLINAAKEDQIFQEQVCTVDSISIFQNNLDMCKDSKGNYYTAGISYSNDLASVTSPRPMFRFEKFDSNFVEQWEVNNENTGMYNRHSFINAYGHSIAVDTAGSVYVSGQVWDTRFSFDSVRYTSNGQYKAYTFIAKLDSLGEFVWVRLFVPNREYPHFQSLSPNTFSDIEIINNRIFVVADIKENGKILKPNSRTTWEMEVDETIYSDKIIEFDTDGNILSIKGISNSFSNRNNYQFGSGCGNMCFEYTRSMHMEVDRFGLLNIYMNRQFRDSIGTIGDFEINNITPYHYYEINVLYDPDKGFINYNIYNDKSVSLSSETLLRHGAFDSFGNKYLVGNCDDVPLDPDGSGSIKNSGSVLKKFDSENNLIWQRRYINTDISEVILSNDETELFLILDTPRDYIGFETAAGIKYFEVNNYDPILLRLLDNGEVANMSVLDIQQYYTASHSYNRLNYFSQDENNFIHYTTGKSTLKIENEKSECTGVAYEIIIDSTLIQNDPSNVDLLCGGDTILFSITSSGESFLWQESADSGNSWKEILDNQIYSGSSTTSLSFISTVDLNQYQYRCKVRSGNKMLISKSASLFLASTPPNLIAENINLYLTDSGEVSLSPIDVVVEANGDCDLADTVLSKNIFGCEDIGISNVSVTLSDKSGNTTMQTIEVSVFDTLKPELISMIPTIDYSRGTVIESPTGLDNCSGTVIGVTEDSINFYQNGNFIINWDLIDATGNTRSLVQYVVVFDDSFISEDTRDTINATSCNIYTSPSGNYIYTESGTYFDTIPNAAGYDSLITINLTINNSTYNILTVVSEDIYTSPSGNYIWNISGTYYDTLANINGCDSIITIDLTIVSGNTSSTIYENACNTYTTPSGKYTLVTSGTYFDTIPNTAGLDSIITIQLTIGQSSNSSQNVTTCNGYRSPSGRYIWTESGTYFDTVPNGTSCYEIATVNLIITKVDTSITVSGNTLWCNKSDADFYQWYNCETGENLIDANGSSYIPSEDGSYAVFIKEGDCYVFSNCYTVDLPSATNTNLSSNTSLYPNPTNGEITIDLGEKKSGFSIKVMDVTGKVVSIESFTNSEKVTLDLLGGFGMYFVHITFENGEQEVFKVFKN